MSEPTYLFIDGGHLRRNYTDTVRRWFGSDGEIRIDTVKTTFSAHKCFYYDSIDDIPHDGERLADCEARVRKQEEVFNRIQSIYGTHVRLGSMTGTRKNKRQKQVDILLAVDVMNHAARRNMGRAVLLTGDQDFKPLVQSVVDMGLFIHVAGDIRHTSRDLAHAADHYEPLTMTRYHQWSARALQTKFPIPIKCIQLLDARGQKKIKKGTIDGEPAECWCGPDTCQVTIQQPRDDDALLTVQFTEVDRLLLFCEMEFGKVEWE
jgi:uncharacterized LabA/DUF88 family protein